MIPTTALALIALALISAATFQFATAGLQTSRQSMMLRRDRKRRLTMLRQAAVVARLNSELQSGQTVGMDWRVMEVAEIVEESTDCKSFYLTDPYQQPLPDFRPGQYLMVRPALAGAYQTTRCYSLSSSPNAKFWRITVKLQETDDEGAKQRNGGLSKWLHRTIRVGDCLLFGGPTGQFFLPADSKRPLVLLAAGVGITPMASMLRWSLEATPDRPVTLLYQAKNGAHWPLGVNLHSWQAQFDHISIRSFFSRATESEIETAREALSGEFVQGKFDYNDALKTPNARECDYYMCGPDPWMTAIRDGLLEAGVPNTQVHWESFGGTGAQPTGALSTSAEALPVQFQHSDLDVQWSDPAQSLWELARESQVEIPSGCLSGVCGCCRAKIISGEVEYDREISVELADDECLTCVSRPKTALVLDV